MFLQSNLNDTRAVCAFKYVSSEIAVGFVLDMADTWSHRGLTNGTSAEA